MGNRETASVGRLDWGWRDEQKVIWRRFAFHAKIQLVSLKSPLHIRTSDSQWLP